MMTFKCGYKSFERASWGKTKPGGDGGWGLMSTFTNGHESWLIDVISYEMSIKNHAINIETHSPVRLRTNNLCHWSIGSCSFDWKWNVKRISSRSQIDARINFSFLLRTQNWWNCFVCGRGLQRHFESTSIKILSLSSVCIFRSELGSLINCAVCRPPGPGQLEWNGEEEDEYTFDEKNANRFVRHTRATHKMYVRKLIKKSRVRRNDWSVG